MPDTNTVYYTFSTMAQVLAAIIAVTAVFVFAKSGEYRTKMQREMGNVVKAFDELIDLKGTWSTELKCYLDQALREATYLRERGIKKRKGTLRNWKDQATRSQREGVVAEMKDIFDGHSARTILGGRMQEACRLGLENHRLNRHMLSKFTFTTVAGLGLIFIDLCLLMLTSESTLCQFREFAFFLMVFVVLVAGAFFAWVGYFVSNTIRE